MNRLKQITKLFIFTIFISFIGTLSVNAASWTIISSASSVSAGGSFKVRIHGNVAGRFDISVSNGTASESTVFKNDLSSDVSFSVTAGNGGSVYVKVTTHDVTDQSYNSVSGSDDVSVGIKSNSSNTSGIRVPSPSNSKTDVKDQSQKSKDNNLKSLSIDNHYLSKEFKSDVLEYSIDINETEEKINIKAEPSDKNATISGAGEITLKEDLNELKIVVTAENGETKTYIIKVNYKDENPIEVKIGKKIYTVAKRKSNLQEFDDYKLQTITINNIEVPALYNKKTKLTLVGLKNNGNVYLYRYDKKKNTYTRYIEYDFKNIKLVLFTPSSKIIPSKYKAYKETIQEHKVNVYKLRKKSKYSMIYGMNLKTGKKNLYLYDSKEETVQRYSDELSLSLMKQNQKYYKICIGLCLAIALLIIIILIIITKKEKGSKVKPAKKYNNNDDE